MNTLTSDYFSLFSLPRSYTLDALKLEQEYFELQKRFHPDRTAAKSTEERQAAMQQSARLNDAYRTLQDPLKRAEYMLSLEGFNLRNVAAGATLLAQVMEWRESLEELHETTRLASLAEKASAIEGECISQLGRAFDANELDSAAALALRLSYLSKWRDEIRQKLLSVKHNAL